MFLDSSIQTPAIMILSIKLINVPWVALLSSYFSVEHSIIDYLRIAILFTVHSCMCSLYLIHANEYFGCLLHMCSQASSIHKIRCSWAFLGLEGQTPKRRCSLAMGDVCSLRTMVCVLLDSGPTSQALPCESCYRS